MERTQVNSSPDLADSKPCTLRPLDVLADASNAPGNHVVLAWLAEVEAARATATPEAIEESEVYQYEYNRAYCTGLALAKGDHARVAAVPLSTLVSSARRRGEDVRVAVVRHVLASRQRCTRRLPRSTMHVRRARRAPRRARRATRAAGSSDDSAGPPRSLADRRAPSDALISRREQSSRARPTAQDRDAHCVGTDCSVAAECAEVSVVVHSGTRSGIAPQAGAPRDGTHNSSISISTPGRPTVYLGGPSSGAAAPGPEIPWCPRAVGPRGGSAGRGTGAPDQHHTFEHGEGHD